MRILYGVVGEGMGHATRSRVILEHLLEEGHRLHVVVSGRAHDFLTRGFSGRSHITFQEIRGLHLVYDGGGIDKSESLWSNLARAPENLRHNLEAYGEVSDAFTADLVISDFESWAYVYAKAAKLPVISLDNMQVINRCRHDEDITNEKCFNFVVSKLAVKAKLPRAYHYLVTSFFFPPVRKRRTTLVPPILRQEILAARREPGDHVLVYQTSSSNTELVSTLQKLAVDFRVYGMGREGQEGRVSLRPFSQQGFIDDLRTARAVIAGGGYSLMGEAVHLRVPMLSVPLAGQYEQELNARYLAKLGYGSFAPSITVEAIESFLSHTDEHAHRLQSYKSQDNRMLFDCVDELVRRAGGGEPAPAFLESPSMADSVGTTIDDELGE